MANFRNFNVQPVNYRDADLIKVPGMALAQPRWLVERKPTPNVSTGMLLPAHTPTVSFASLICLPKNDY